MLEFQVFRIQVYPSAQNRLFEKRKTPSEILKETINSLPTAELRKGRIWHIGNISNVDDKGIYFRIGRTTTSKIAVYEDGNFDDEEFETAPYTHVILDVPLEVCAIAKNNKLSSKATGIATKFIRLLNESEHARHVEAVFEISAINDPEDFVSQLHHAFSISRFWVTFSRPNAFDANEDFYKPFTRLLKESDGEKGKTELSGHCLKSDSLEDIARTAASTGNEAAAWLQADENSPKVKKHLKGNPVIVTQDNIADDKKIKTLLNRVRSLYKKVRGTNGINNEK